MSKNLFVCVMTLAASAGVTACGKGAPQQTCDLSDGRKVSAGAVFSDGCNCCLCSTAGVPTCQAAACTISVDGGHADRDTTPCQSNADCASSFGAAVICIFDRGCTEPQGHCTGNGTCPLFIGNFASDYCGCDGQTFHVGALNSTGQYPDRPYAHLGACP